MFALRPVQVEYRTHLPYLFGQLSFLNISGWYACEGICSCLTHSFSFVDAKSKLLEASLLINPSVYSFQNFEYLRYDPGNWKYLLDQIDRNQHWNIKICTCQKPTCCKVTAYSFLGIILPYCIISFTTATKYTKSFCKNLKQYRIYGLNNISNS